MNSAEFVGYCRGMYGSNCKKIAEKYIKEHGLDKEYTEDDFIEVYRRTEAQELDYYHPRFRMYDGVMTTKRFDVG